MKHSIKYYPEGNIFTLLLFLLLSCCCLISSCRCAPQSINREKQNYGIQLATTGVSVRGGIIRDQKVQPIIEIHGTITENHLSTEMQLGILVIPKTNTEHASARNALEAFRNSKDTWDDKQRCILVENNTGGVYYVKKLSKEEIGMQQTELFLAGIDPPTPGTSYVVYFIVHSKEHGTYLSEEGGVTFEIPTPKDPVPTLTLGANITIGKQLKHGADESELVLKEAKANTDIAQTDFSTAGFILAKKTNDYTAIDDLLAKQIIAGQDLSSTPTQGANDPFQLFPNQSDVLLHTAKLINNNELTLDDLILDMPNLFRQGDTFNAAAYIEIKTTDGKIYYLLTQEKPILIKKSSLKLAIRQHDLIKLIQDLTVPKRTPEADYNEFNIESNVSIEEHEGTFDPKIGLFYLQNNQANVVTQARLEEILSEVLKQGTEKNNWKQKDHNLAYTATNIQVGQTGNLKLQYDNEIPGFIFGDEYTVYVFVSDLEDVFLSPLNDGIEFSIPKIELEVTEFKINKAGVDLDRKNKYVITENGQGLTGEDKINQTGYIFTKTAGNEVVNKKIIDKVLDKLKAVLAAGKKDIEQPSNLADDQNNPDKKILLISNALLNQNNHKIKQELMGSCEEEEVFEESTLYFKHKDKDMLFYKKLPPAIKFEWPYFEPTFTTIDIKLGTNKRELKVQKADGAYIMNKTYTLNYDNRPNGDKGQTFVKRKDGQNLTVLDINNADDRIIIEAIIKQQFSSPSQAADYLKAMKEYANKQP